jgi:hypothetical protein
MRSLIGLALAVAALAVPFLSGSESAIAAPRVCKHAYGGRVVIAHKVGCKKSRRVVHAWARGFNRDGRANREARGFKCVKHPAIGFVVVCERGHQRLSFYGNAH